MKGMLLKTIHFPRNPNPPPNCVDCGFREECGGLEGADYLQGCFSRCTVHCKEKGCDLACPSLPFLYPELVEEVHGICSPPKPNLKTCTAFRLPRYIAQIDHGSSRDRLLNEEVVTVPIHSIFGKIRRKKYGIRYESAESFRKAFKLKPDSEVILTCIAPDQHLEDFWFSHVNQEILAQLAALRLRAITVPNFSFMLDVPRTNAMHNFGRMFRVAERAAEAGLAVIFHLQASNQRDWQRWNDVLIEQPKASCVALEFQTGASRRNIGDPYYAGLFELQQKLGRPLHPIVLAGAGRIRQLNQDFQSFSVVDSTPFIKTMNRQVLFHMPNGKWKWHTALSKAGESLSARMESNINGHRNRLLNQMASAKNIPEQPQDFLLAQW